MIFTVNCFLIMPPHQKFKKSTKKEPPCLKTHLYSYYLSAETSCQNPENKKKELIDLKHGILVFSSRSITTIIQSVVVI